MICYIHFNKCGGTTFMDIAEKNCRLYSSYVKGVPALPSDPVLPISGSNWKLDQWWLKEDKEKQKVLAGNHDLFGIEIAAADEPMTFFNEWYPEVSYVTILRDPLDVMLSRYNHLSNAGFKPEEPLKDWLITHRHPNFFTTIFSSNWEQPDLEKAKKQLLKLKALMFVETFQQDIYVMRRKFAWTILNTTKFRSGTKNESNFRFTFRDDLKFIVQMQKRHALDLEFYSWAIKAKRKINL